MLYSAWLKLVAMGKGQRNNDGTCIRLCNSASRSLTTLLNRREQWKMSTSTVPRMYSYTAVLQRQLTVRVAHTGIKLFRGFAKLRGF